MMLSVLVSCYQSHKRELDLAYTLAEFKPDSALAFLNRINQGKLSDEDMAKYATLSKDCDKLAYPKSRIIKSSLR